MADGLTSLLPTKLRARLRPQRRPASPGIVTALDLDGSTLRVAQADNRKVRMVATAQLDLPPDANRADPVVVGGSIKRALAHLNLRPGSVVMGLGRQRVVLRTLWLPAIENVSELASVVHFQVAKDLPFPAEEAIIDFQAGREVQHPPERAESGPKPESEAEPESAAPRMEVLVAAVKRDVVEFHQQLAVAAGFKLAGLGFLPYANCRCLAACEKSGGAEVLALVALRPDEVSVEVMAGHALLFSRGTVMRTVGETPHIDGAVPVTPEAFVQAALIEALRSLHVYGGTEPNLPVSKVVIAGATNCEATLLDTLHSRVSAPCKLLDPAGALGLPGKLREAAAGSIGAIGLALSFGDEHGLSFDFLNAKRPAVQRNVRRERIVMGAVAGLVFLVTLFGARKFLINRRTAVLNATSAELTDAEKKRPIYRTMINHAGVVGDWVKGGRDWLQHYAYLTSVLPPCEEIYLTSLAVDHQGIIRLTVQARSGELLTRLNQQLREAGYQVKPYAINPGANRFGYEFRSNIELVPLPKLKIDLAKLKPVARPADDASLDPKAWRRGGQ